MDSSHKGFLPNILQKQSIQSNLILLLNATLRLYQRLQGTAPTSPLGVSQTWQFPKLTLPQQITIRGASLVTLEHIGPQEGGFVPTFSPIFFFFSFLA